MARFLITLKCPYLDLSNKRVYDRATRSGKIGSHWYKANAAQTIEQQVGRGVRNKDDYCEMYLLDSQIENLIYKHPTLFSEHFRNCIVL